MAKEMACVASDARGREERSTDMRIEGQTRCCIDMIDLERVVAKDQQGRKFAHVANFVRNGADASP